VKEFQSVIQSAWGVALLVMGIAFFFQIPDIMSRLSTVPYSQGALIFMRICLYLISILLVGGGIGKLRTLATKK
jgi:hypothetical protein